LDARTYFNFLFTGGFPINPKLVEVAVRYSFQASILLAVTCWAFAQPPAALAQERATVEPAQPLSSRLNPDGTLNLETGFSGSLDASGWQMLTGPNGEPRFAPATERMRKFSAAEDENWDDRFGLPGANGNVVAIAISGDEVYVGGFFTTIGNVSVSRIAKWNSATNTWSALGSGVEGTVLEIAVNGNDVYVGGIFEFAGGVSANHIARWNNVTSTWSALGSGVSGGAFTRVFSIAISGSDVYVGGAFTTAGGVSASNIAKWDGSNWSALGSGVSGGGGGGLIIGAFAIAVSGNDVYVGGSFATAGGINANRIAKWNSATNIWSALGSGVQGGTPIIDISAVAVSGNDVYVGGTFSTAGNVSANNIAKWNSVTNTWSALGSGINGFVQSLAASGIDVYVGGAFEFTGGVSANGIAKWNTSTNTWSALGNLVGGQTVIVVGAIAIAGNDVYAGGDFTIAGGGIAENIAKWNGSSWSTLGNAPNNNINAVAVSGNEIVVGGEFTAAGTVGGANRIAKWNSATNTWSGLGSGLDGTVNAVAVNGSEVYAGGSFGTAGGVSASRIAKWDGNNWSALGSGISGGAFNSVNAIAASGSSVYAGGLFTTAGGVSASNIAKWDGSTWSALGTGTNGSVFAVAVSGSEVYVGGFFSRAGGLVVNNIAKWDGSNWSALGTGTNALVSAIVVSGNQVYVGGGFTSAGGATANRLAVWDNAANTWSEVGGGLNNRVVSLGLSGNDLFVGGTFTTAGTETANRIAKWNSATNTWSALGSGLNDVVNAIAVSERDVYVGGLFTTAGGKPSFKFAHWSEPVTSVAARDPLPLSFALEQNYPNPFNPATVIGFQLPVASEVRLSIYNINGQLVKQLVNGEFAVGKHQIVWDATNARGERVSSGVYLYRLEAGSFTQQRKLLLMK
jgi:hypothetical protein